MAEVPVVSTAGRTKLDGSDIGDQDGGAKRPYFDGNNFITTVVDKTVTKKDRSDTKPRDIVNRYVDTNRTINTTLNHSRTLTLTRTRVVTAGCGPGVNTKTISLRPPPKPRSPKPRPMPSPNWTRRPITW